MENTNKEQVIELEKKKGVVPGTFLNWEKMELLGGESDDEVIERVKSFFESEVYEDLKTSEVTKILAVTSCGTLLFIQRYLLSLYDKNYDGRSVPFEFIENASLTVIDLKLDRKSKEILDLKFSNEHDYLK